MSEIGLCLGSNLGDRLANLRRAAEAVDRIDGVTVAARSPIYETEPVDVRPENRDLFFLNAVLIVDSSMEPRALLHRLHDIENSMGRVRTGDRNAPRAIDIDILYAGDVRIEEGDLKIPHPQLLTRRFVVRPLADVRPGLILPGVERSVSEILLSLPDTPKVVLFSAEW
jgi:2-amino-4-hydroxy-6-hydroxymethyldihydropteridine diphosphokinase